MPPRRGPRRPSAVVLFRGLPRRCYASSCTRPAGRLPGGAGPRLAGAVAALLVGAAALPADGRGERPAPAARCSPDVHPPPSGDFPPSPRLRPAPGSGRFAGLRTKLREWGVPLPRRLLPLPRVVRPGDPDLVVPARFRRARIRDEQDVRRLQRKLQEALQEDRRPGQPLEERQKRVGQLVHELYETLYGPGVTPHDRQSFLEQFGCTAWSEESTRAILEEVPYHRGIVEIGAGNGQWARHLNEAQQRQQQPRQQSPPVDKHFDYVLAYDDGSDLPLKSDVYHSGTAAYRRHFFHRVRPCPSVEAALSRWDARGRALLLVYPPPDTDLAVRALRAYTSSSDRRNDTLLYVGEGRGGSTATDAFFDALEEDASWVLHRVVPVQPFGTKGCEKLYVFRRQQQRPIQEQGASSNHNGAAND